MKTELREAMTSGVYVEFRDGVGNTVGQALYTDWRGRPVPAVGDMLASDVPGASTPKASASAAKLSGCVIARYFELQTEADGTPCVWVRLIVEVTSGRRELKSRSSVTFSRN